MTDSSNDSKKLCESKGGEVFQPLRVIIGSSSIVSNSRKQNVISGRSSPFPNEGGTGGMGGGDNPLDSFFPFDPYLLYRSSKYIQPIYVKWDSCYLGDKDEPTVNDRKYTTEANRIDLEANRIDSEGNVSVVVDVLENEIVDHPMSPSSHSAQSDESSESESDSEVGGFGYNGIWKVGMGMASLNADWETNDLADFTAGNEQSPVVNCRGKKRNSDRKIRTRTWSHSSLSELPKNNFILRDKCRSDTTESLNPRPLTIQRTITPEVQ